MSMVNVQGRTLCPSAGWLPSTYQARRSNTHATSYLACCPATTDVGTDRCPRRSRRHRAHTAVPRRSAHPSRSTQPTGPLLDHLDGHDRAALGHAHSGHPRKDHGGSAHTCRSMLVPMGTEAALANVHHSQSVSRQTGCGPCTIHIGQTLSNFVHYLFCESMRVRGCV